MRVRASALMVMWKWVYYAPTQVRGTQAARCKNANQLWLLWTCCIVHVHIRVCARVIACRFVTKWVVCTRSRSAVCVCVCVCVCVWICDEVGGVCAVKELYDRQIKLAEKKGDYSITQVAFASAQTHICTYALTHISHMHIRTYALTHSRTDAHMHICT